MELFRIISNNGEYIEVFATSKKEAARKLLEFDPSIWETGFTFI